MATAKKPPSTTPAAAPRKKTDPNAPVAMTFRLHPHLQKAVRHAAIDEGIQVQGLITQALEEWLIKHGHGDRLA